MMCILPILTIQTYYSQYAWAGSMYLYILIFLFYSKHVIFNYYCYNIMLNIMLHAEVVGKLLIVYQFKITLYTLLCKALLACFILG